MTKRSRAQTDRAGQNIFAGGGEMGALMRDFDWSKTPLGPVESWSLTLRVMAKLLLANRFPMLLWWGAQFIQLYNDAYRPVLGDKHPHAALGKPFSECWSEVFHVLGPLAQTPFDGGPPTWMEDIPLEVNRYSFVEETHFTIAYSPVPDDTAPNGIGGVLATVHEISEKIVGERRVRALRDLAARPAEAKTAEEASAMAAATLADYSKDVPFALVYLLEADGKSARLAGHAGTETCADLRPEQVDFYDKSETPWPFAAVEREQQVSLIDNLQERFGRLPAGPWADPANSAAVVPIKSNIARHLAGFLVAGISPRLRFDDQYRGFLELASAQIAIAIANARAYEEERKRNEALAEIDRAKTTFFTNISHEFRTPLTLMLGPLEDMLAGDDLPVPLRERLDLAHRNSLRLLKLVNTLLDFSRIESGRIQALYEPVNLSGLTLNLASVFRSAIDRAGMNLLVDCPPLNEPVYVDREMWEKIVLNLLSNAFKFTLQGEIKISMKRAGKMAELKVSDTGCGIKHEDLPHIFERFYRVRNPQGRSYEGSGIGLALVHELVRLSGGEIRVESEPGRGTTFTVSIPFGRAHLPAERVGSARTMDSTAVDAEAYVQEAQRWLPGAESAPIESKAYSTPVDASQSRPRIVLADDNTDMREYVRRLLAQAYNVEVVTDGQSALESALAHPPDMVLADVMMPRLDGFGLLKRLRADERTASVPVVLLSARAGEEARVEGATARADDYLVKPFSARELLARVENHLALSRMRREAEQRVRESEERFRALVAASSDAVYRMSADWSEMRELHGRNFIPDTQNPSRLRFEKYIHPDDRSRVMAAIQAAIHTKSVLQIEHRVMRPDGTSGWTFLRAIPLLDMDGETIEWFGAATDITARKQAEEALVRSEKLASLGRLAATIAHEINNPLEAVTNLIYLAQTADNLPSSARRHLQMADTELQRVAHTARQSLGFYREYNAPALTSANALLDSAIELLTAKINSKQAKIEREFRTDVEIMAVAGELRQVFSNLLTNSLDALDPRGTIKLRISTCSLGTGSPGLRITVADNGKGISRASQTRIFEPFFTTKGTFGTGLGLWVTKQIIEKHGGHIQMHSRNQGADRGTVFSVVLPVQPAKEEAKGETAAS
jgi:signal transduction histidine kinase